MLATLGQLIAMLNRRERYQMLGLLVSALVAAMFELVGVTSIMPFMGVAANPQLIHQQPFLEKIYVQLGFDSSRSFLIFWGAVVLLALTTVHLLTAFNLWLGCRFGYHQQRRLSRRLYLAYLTRPYHWHLERHSTEMLDDLKRARGLTDGVYRPLTTMLARGGTALALVLALFWMDAVVALVTSALLGGLFSLVYLRSRSRLRRLSRQELEAAQATERSLADSLGALKQIKLGHSYAHFCRLYDQQVSELTNYINQRTLAAEMPRITLHSLANTAVLGVVIYLQATLTNPDLLIPLVSLYALAAFRILPALHQCLGSAFVLAANRAVVEKLSSELSRLPEEDSLPTLPTARPMQGSLKLLGVTYSYPQSGAPALQDCTLEIKRGTRVGLVGSTGSGKTTLLNLLVGLLEPQKGWLELDGVRLGEESWPGLQRTIGYVPQDVYLADDTLRNNIALGHDDVLPERLLWAARMACLEEFVQTLPAGYDTLVGERGIRLSGGQRQRLGLARALYSDPQLLVLDEATSALDSGTESQVIASLATLEGERTVVTVAHRLSTVQHCDVIYVLSGGRVVGSGTYAELLKGNAEFRALAPSSN